MLDRFRNYSKSQKIILAFTAVLLTGCLLCCACSGLIALLPSGDDETIAEAASEMAEAETASETLSLETESELALEPTHTPVPATTTPRATNTPRPTNTASPSTSPSLNPSPTLTNTPETGKTGQLTLNSGDLVAGGLVAGDLAAVTRIIDGDTIEVEINGQMYRVRYIGMDTPERGDPFFDEATAANRQLVEGQAVTLVKDVSETDRYGRLLRYIYLSDGTFVNAELVRQGYALVATFPPDVAHQALFVQLQQEARDAGLGLWGQIAPTLPPATFTPQPTNPPIPTNTPLPATPTAVPLPPTNTPAAAPTAVPVPPTEPPPPPSNCDPSYPTVCIPPPPPDLDCGQIPYRNFTVLEPDPHGFDRDNDGIGCES